jgi:hypothetical protein
MEQRHQDTRARAAEGMAQRNGSTERVHPRALEAKNLEPRLVGFLGKGFE